ncbi:MAG: glycosyltransferase [Desulfovibrionaceae bacterium]|nr:glycosyltransferase [Desulfovibrionaceae bacterium]MBF0515033.1 glycosyltransferase [Desulfovibrionaceae bacterium]
MNSAKPQPGRPALPHTAFISLWFPKPSETFVYREVLALWRLGLPVRVFSLYGPVARGLSEEMRNADIPIERLGLAAIARVLAVALASLLVRPAKTLRILTRVLTRPAGGAEKFGENILAAFCGFTLARRCRQLGVEHVHAAWANGSATAAWVVHALTGIPFSFSARAGDVHPPDGLLPLKLREAAFARVDSSYNLPHLRALIPDAPGKIHLVYNARTMAAFREAPVPMNAPVNLLGIGRFVETKGFQYLIEALALLRAKNIDVRLTLAGDGPWKGRLTALAAKRGVADRVGFPGFVAHDQVSRLLTDSDMLVMPSIRMPNGDSDGLPTVINEALYHRLPVVATGVASISDVVKNGQTGLLAPERDAKALAEAIETMLNNRGQALAMAEAGRKLALEMFDPETCIGKMKALLEGEERENQGETPFL